MMMLKMMMPSVPKMPGGDDGEKKEESAESREEAKEQVHDGDDQSKHCIGKVMPMIKARVAVSNWMNFDTILFSLPYPPSYSTVEFDV